MAKTCLKCAHQAEGSPLECPQCGAVYAKLEALAQAGHVIRSIQPPTAEEREAARSKAREAQALQMQTTAQQLQSAKRTGNWSGIAPEVINREAAGVIVVTTDEVPGRCIEAPKGIVAADSAFAFGAIFEEVAGLVRDVVGSGRSQKTVEFLQRGRQEVLHLLKLRALDVGADAVVGVRIDYEEFSGANQRGILVVIATGTAVILKADPVS